MNNPKEILDDKKYNKLIVVLSVAIPVVVAILFGVKIDAELPVFLPPIYASVNAATALVLVLAFIAIKNKKIKLHERLMKFAIAFVLITYVRAITNNIEKHKKIAKITFPLWLYVAITGVVVYIMISPYY